VRNETSPLVRAMRRGISRLLCACISLVRAAMYLLLFPLCQLALRVSLRGTNQITLTHDPSGVNLLAFRISRRRAPS
jgi:hypothetical protein